MADLPLPPLAAVRCFEAAARLGSFTAAAENLGMTQAAVSYQIKILEERVGTPLFARGPRGVSLTEAGRQLAPAVTDSFTQLRAAFEALSTSAEGVLSISVVNTFATNWLVPRLGEFQLAHPGTAVRLDTAQRFVDFARDPVDLAVRSGPGDWPGLAQHRLMGITYTPLLSPRLREKLPPLRHPADLLGAPLIEPSDPWWLDWFNAAGVPTAELSRRNELQVQTQSLAGSIALAGHGVAILTPAFFAEPLAAGRLVQPFPFVREAPSAYWLVYPEARRRSPKIRAFREWLLDTLASDAQAGL